MILVPLCGTNGMKLIIKDCDSKFCWTYICKWFLKNGHRLFCQLEHGIIQFKTNLKLLVGDLTLSKTVWTLSSSWGFNVKITVFWKWFLLSSSFRGRCRATVVSWVNVKVAPQKSLFIACTPEEENKTHVENICLYWQNEMFNSSNFFIC